MPDLTFETKGSLRKMIEMLWEENRRLKEAKKGLIEKTSSMRKELNESLKLTLNLQEQVLEFQDKILEHYGIENKPYMKVAE